MYEESLGAAGYDTFKLARTNNRGDGTQRTFLLIYSHTRGRFQDFVCNLDRYGGSYVLLSARVSKLSLNQVKII